MKNFDQKISKQIYHTVHKVPVLTMLAKFGATYMIVIMVLLGFFMVGNANAFSSRFVFTLFFAWGAALALQFLVRRRRPFECLLYESKVKLFCKTPSFPSAHATIAFATASLMYGQNIFLFVFFLLTALWISLSRVAVGVHYFSDVVAGTLIGFVAPSVFISLWLSLV